VCVCVRACVRACVCVFLSLSLSLLQNSTKDPRCTQLWISQQQLLTSISNLLATLWGTNFTNGYVLISNLLRNLSPACGFFEFLSESERIKGGFFWIPQKIQKIMNWPPVISYHFAPQELRTAGQIPKLGPFELFVTKLQHTTGYKCDMTPRASPPPTPSIWACSTWVPNPRRVSRPILRVENRKRITLGFFLKSLFQRHKWTNPLQKGTKTSGSLIPIFA
jgi:hypothetical protein